MHVLKFWEDTYEQHDFGKVMLPFTVLRRLDCVLADSKDKVLAYDVLAQTAVTITESTEAGMADAFAFDGERCDRLVARVFRRILWRGAPYMRLHL